jgi:hypothetical protein
MRRGCVVLMLVLLGLILPPRPASAAGFIEWLERLSGPGPFIGGGVSVQFVCLGFKGRDTERSLFVSPYCREIDRESHPIFLGVDAAWLTGENNLEYDQLLPEGARNVRMFKMGVTGDYGITRSFDIGVGLGFMRLTGMPADTFTRFTIQPVRVTWKPLTMRSSPDRDEVVKKEWLQIRYVATVIPGGFDDGDFGARPGSFDVGTEFLSSINIVISYR